MNSVCYCEVWSFIALFAGCLGMISQRGVILCMEVHPRYYYWPVSIFENNIVYCDCTHNLVSENVIVLAVSCAAQWQ